MCHLTLSILMPVLWNSLKEMAMAKMSVPVPVHTPYLYTFHASDSLSFILYFTVSHLTPTASAPLFVYALCHLILSRWPYGAVFYYLHHSSIHTFSPTRHTKLSKYPFITLTIHVKYSTIILQTTLFFHFLDPWPLTFISFCCFAFLPAITLQICCLLSLPSILCSNCITTYFCLLQYIDYIFYRGLQEQNLWVGRLRPGVFGHSSGLRGSCQRKWAIINNHKYIYIPTSLHYFCIIL